LQANVSPLGFESRLQWAAFGLMCLVLVIAPYLFSGFWPVSREYASQAFLSALTACAALLLALSPRPNKQQAVKSYSRAFGFFSPGAFLSAATTVYWHDTLLELARLATGFAWFLVARELLNTATTDERVLDSRRCYVLGSNNSGLPGWCASWP
jgi:hypothetical protein